MSPVALRSENTISDFIFVVVVFLHQSLYVLATFGVRASKEPSGLFRRVFSIQITEISRFNIPSFLDYVLLAEFFRPCALLAEFFRRPLYPAPPVTGVGVGAARSRS